MKGKAATFEQPGGKVDVGFGVVAGQDLAVALIDDQQQDEDQPGGRARTEEEWSGDRCLNGCLGVLC